MGSSDRANAYYVQSDLGPESYDLIYARSNPAMIAFYIDTASRNGTCVLELGVGTGQVALALAAAGLNVVGIDISTGMLEAARHKADKLTPEVRRRVEFLRADMADFDLLRLFDTVIIPGRGFQHLITGSAQKAALRCIYCHLKPGGSLAMNLFDFRPDYCRSLLVEEYRDEVSGQMVRRHFLDRHDDLAAQTFTEHMRLEYVEASGSVLRSEDTEWTLRWMSQQEMRELLEGAGFEIVALYSDFLGSPPAIGKEQVWVVRRI